MFIFTVKKASLWKIHTSAPVSKSELIICKVQRAAVAVKMFDNIDHVCANFSQSLITMREHVPAVVFYNLFTDFIEIVLWHFWTIIDKILSFENQSKHSNVTTYHWW